MDSNRLFESETHVYSSHRLSAMKDLLEKILSYLPVYIPDLVRIVSGPKRFVAERNKGSEEDLIKAFTFLGVSLAIFFILQAGVPAKDFLTDTAIHGILYLLFVVVFSGILRLSWRIVGGRAEYESFLITSSYYVGVLSIGFAGGALCFIGILRLLYPVSYSWFVKFIAAPSLWKAYDPRFSRSILVAFVGFLTLGVPTSVWAFIGWGAYRELNQLPRSRSCAALFLTTLFSLPVVAGLFIMAF
jgi:hypothetical protein